MLLTWSGCRWQVFHMSISSPVCCRDGVTVFASAFPSPGHRDGALMWVHTHCGYIQAFVSSASISWFSSSFLFYLRTTEVLVGLDCFSLLNCFNVKCRSSLSYVSVVYEFTFLMLHWWYREVPFVQFYRYFLWHELSHYFGKVHSGDKAFIFAAILRKWVLCIYCLVH